MQGTGITPYLKGNQAERESPREKRSIANEVSSSLSRSRKALCSSKKVSKLNENDVMPVKFS